MIKRIMESRLVPIKELADCPRHILSPAHYIPEHKIQECADLKPQDINIMQQAIKLYHHKTDGGAEYLMDTFTEWEHNGKSGKEGVINDETEYIVRIDGDITKDAELNIR